ncbi:MAG: hypothetical protein A2506_00850 [Elusimicrobia bacterium RIFOXYD12_FULL_66_9]|nr:MAG: hypothetical protein A2506_00850 [Elusimicrobia bacterium RIFOXYD12_FULL_66_9]
MPKAKPAMETSPAEISQENGAGPPERKSHARGTTRPAGAAVYCAEQASPASAAEPISQALPPPRWKRMAAA